MQGVSREKRKVSHNVLQKGLFMVVKTAKFQLLLQTG